MLVLLDVNVLIALSWPQHVHHAQAHRWFDDLRPLKWATTPITELGFVRLSAHPAVVGQPVAPADAISALQQIRQLAGHTFLPDDSSLVEPRISLVRLAGRGQVTDLHLVNLAAKHGGRLATLDHRLVSYLEPADAHYLEQIEVRSGSTG